MRTWRHSMAVVIPWRTHTHTHLIEATFSTLRRPFAPKTIWSVVRRRVSGVFMQCRLHLGTLRGRYGVKYKYIGAVIPSKNEEFWKIKGGVEIGGQTVHPPWKQNLIEFRRPRYGMWVQGTLWVRYDFKWMCRVRYNEWGEVINHILCMPRMSMMKSFLFENHDDQPYRGGGALFYIKTWPTCVGQEAWHHSMVAATMPRVTVSIIEYLRAYGPCMRIHRQTSPAQAHTTTRTHNTHNAQGNHNAC